MSYVLCLWTPVCSSVPNLWSKNLTLWSMQTIWQYIAVHCFPNTLRGTPLFEGSLSSPDCNSNESGKQVANSVGHWLDVTDRALVWYCWQGIGWTVLTGHSLDVTDRALVGCYWQGICWMLLTGHWLDVTDREFVGCYWQGIGWMLLTRHSLDVTDRALVGCYWQGICWMLLTGHWLDVTDRAFVGCYWQGIGWMLLTGQETDVSEKNCHIVVSSTTSHWNP
jgi:hypothetical protein